MVGAALAASATGQRVLAVVEKEYTHSYDAYLTSLQQRGFEVSVQAPDDAQDNTLFEFGERKFDHLLFLAPTIKQFPRGLTTHTIVEFLREGGNMLAGVSPQLSESWRDFAREFGLEFGERGTMLVDHLGYDQALDTGNHAAVLVGGHRDQMGAGGLATEAGGVFSDETRSIKEALVYRGIAHWVGPNPLAFPLLRPPTTSYQTDPPSITTSPDGSWHAANVGKLEALHSQPDLLTGADAHTPDASASLATAIQLRDNSARVVFVGSTELFGDLYKGAARPLQRAFVDDITSWTFQERGVLRVVRTAHQRLRANEHDVRPDYEENEHTSSMYRIKDTLSYSLQVAMFDGQTWGPAPSDLDLQLSAVMLDPYVTVPLKPHRGPYATMYEADLRLPDRHGVFTLRVNWKRHGWSYVRADDVVPVRPFNHDEYPRMLSSSWPYIAGAFSTMFGFVAFVYLWLTMPVEKLASKTS
ncbi:oligosaccharyl transferase glycoprotein complex, beta subunit [Malassezia caprae]|uniref:Dolichyl-diphosphooligosaccharide--protein glycosyltransferase subunit WBP1 n=1 Tax=Malassezia caprae TaxID=1381934 RepID=A0AAF0E5Z4_9BASI|nr:oligosaccharyl transferase glycoprotein complex, beta subunit [Malassezia caprae]